MSGTLASVNKRELDDVSYVCGNLLSFLLKQFTELLLFPAVNSKLLYIIVK